MFRIRHSCREDSTTGGQSCRYCGFPETLGRNENICPDLFDFFPMNPGILLESLREGRCPTSVFKRNVWEGDGNGRQKKTKNSVEFRHLKGRQQQRAPGFTGKARRPRHLESKFFFLENKTIYAQNLVRYIEFL
ncbi:hypothetical protein RUM44_003101 [Polyplax serrata]|uniref:Uncharacterized protein n=1 Tax=Polyplax serrata TaxID=468196 RepID=A0ABR1AXJ5_POLSC